MTDRETRREGWYADPLGQADLRWWDSQNWTTQTTSSRATTSRPGANPLQWAEDELPAPKPASNGARVSPPMAQPAADSKFALDATLGAPAPAPEPSVAGGPDWSPLMRALLTAGDAIVTATAQSLPTITIDMAQHTYWWDWSLDSFPAHPVDLVVNTVARSDAANPAVAGRYIEPLLWRVGIGANSLSERIDATLRYKLRRWPDLGTMPHTADQLRAIKVLASAQLTPAELSAIAEIADQDARTLIGTFTLMSLLDSVKDPATAR
jgi:hypothetical protein